MCTCLEKSLKDTSTMLVGSIMNRCETESAWEYIRQNHQSLMIDSTDEDAITDFSMYLVQTLTKNECNVLDEYKKKIMRDATQGSK